MSDHGRQRIGKHTLVWLALILLAMTGCRQAPEEVLEEARMALSQSDKKMALNDFLAVIEPRAAAFLIASDRVVQFSKEFKVLRVGRPNKDLLPRGDVVDLVEQGKRCIVVVKKGRAKQPIPMRLVRGQWKIDLFEMPSFYKAIAPE